MTSVDVLLAEGRAPEALQAVDALLQDDPTSLDLLARRVDCLMAIGQFERALDAARVVLARDADHSDARSHLQIIEAELAPPRLGSSDPSLRSYRSELPQTMLLRLQKALHHQTYRGVQCVKNPFDLALYQQLVHRLRPRTIVEIGSKAGGSALFFGDLLRNFDVDGHVLSYDVVPVKGIEHPLVTFARGNGRDLGPVLSDRDVEALPRPLLVIEDADHTQETTGAVLEFFHKRFSIGDWIVVEDGNLSDIYPAIYPDQSSGPHMALKAFFREHATEYRVAAEYCDFYAYNGTTCSNGILERVRL